METVPATRGGSMPEDCIFCRIAAGAIPVQPQYEDEEFIAFRDAHPQAPVHVLLIPKQHYATIMEIEDGGLLGRALQAVQQTAKILGIADEGFRTVLNTRDNGGQTVYHVHWHILGGRFMQWPPG
jgi:histidine triad (HIT) family protein